jgi:outer membrane protein assembly factor BamB
MKKLLTFTAIWSLVLPLAAGADWPQWRGPEGTGVAPAADPPVRWSETENVRWKVPIPGRGHAAPIVWGERVYLLTAVPVEGARPPEPPADADERTRERWMRAVHPVEQRFVVMALNRRDGSVAWERTAVEAVPHEGTHRDGTWASASPVTDGAAVYAQFGSQGLFAYSLDGELLWQRDLGDMSTRNGFGEGASPAVHGDKLIVNWDHEGDSFIVALDKKTGKTVWQKSRDEITSWSTPLVVEAGERPQVVVAATGKSRAYDLATGEVVWEAAGMTVNVVPTPVYGHGMVYLTSGFRGSALQAVRVAEAKGEVTAGEAVAWTHDRDTPYVPSPLLYGDQLYFLKVNSGILSCLDAKTGKIHFNEQRLEGVRNVYASPVGADGRVYLVGREGTTVVLEHGPEYKVLAQNTLDEGFDSSPAVAGEELYLRGSQHLYCLAEGKKEAAAGS